MGIFSALGKKFLPGELSRDADPHVLPYFLADGQYYQSGKHRAEEAAMIAQWLVRLRWVAICGFLVLAGCFLIFFRALMPIGALYGLCGVIFLYNLAFFLFLKSQKSTAYQTALFSIRLQVFLDWLALLLFIHFTGGIFSPLMFFVILHVIINAMIFSPRQCYMYTALLLSGACRAGVSGIRGKDFSGQQPLAGTCSPAAHADSDAPGVSALFIRPVRLHLSCHRHHGPLPGAGERGAAPDRFPAEGAHPHGDIV